MILGHGVSGITPSLLSKIQGLCNSFGEKVGLDCTFDFHNKLIAKSNLPLEKQLLDLGCNELRTEEIDPNTDRTHCDLAYELIKQFETIIEETQDTQNEDCYLKTVDFESPEADHDGDSSSRSGKSIFLGNDLDHGLQETPYRIRASSFK